MTILSQVLRTTTLRKTQKRFFETLVYLWLAIPGRINFKNLARYGELSEKSYRNWFAKPLSFIELNAAVIMQLEAQSVGRFVLGIDASFIRKSGKASPELAKFWDGTRQRTCSGLELSCCSLIELEHKQAFSLEGFMTPAEPEGNRIDAYAQHVETVLRTLPANLAKQLHYVVGDAYYTKQSFITKIRQQHRHFVGKLRRDANLKYLYDGPRTGKPGRPRLYDGKVDFKDFSKWQCMTQIENATLYYCNLYAPSLKQRIRVIAIVRAKGYQLFFSTDLEQDALDILAIYRARFQMEFPFRDAKQFAGLQHCQSRQPRTILFHWNMALFMVNLVKAEQLLNHQGHLHSFRFSIEDAKRRAYNQFFAESIIRFLPFDLTRPKFFQLIHDALSIGVKAA